jgi:hypothetical protein
MLSFKKLVNIAGLTVLAITAYVFFLTVERTGSLWDCGEFILGAYKLQVVHPPGAGLFLIIGRIFSWIASIFSDDKSSIAFAVNMLSGLSTAVSAMCIAWATMIIGKLALVGRDNEPDMGQNIALTISGIAAGLSSAWISSVWFSAVEGEVYAMSLMFMSLTLWAGIKWYHLPDNKESDRWLILALFLSGLSVGVHLLSILGLPALAIFYYFKKYGDRKSIKGFLACIAAGLFMIYFIMKIVIVGIPKLWSWFELMFVNGIGLPFNSGIYPTILLIAAIFYYLFKYSHKKGNQLLQNFFVAAAMIVIAYSTVGVVVIRANADTPVNMNTPNDAFRLIPYLNREQYGERPLLKGPHYLAKPTGVTTEPRYGKKGNKYEYVDEKFDYTWKESDKIFFPRIGHQDKADLHMKYKERFTGNAGGKPTFGYNLSFFFKFQLTQMYLRYFFWNFIGRQNFDQSQDIWQVKDGNWYSGIKSYDDNRLYNSDLEPDEMKNAPSRNKYYFIPFILGLLGMVFHFNKSRRDFLALFAFFIITGVGLIIYSNSPPIEPRERDYVFVGSFIIYCMWIGMSGLALYEALSKIKLPTAVGGFVGGAMTLIAPYLFISQNYNDSDRSHHYASRDYAANFLNSVEKNAIIFTYGDNDTYPLWYAQEVEDIRRDVRVVNLSLIQVDWYINKLRSKVNESPAIKLTMSADSYLGKNANQVFFSEGGGPMSIIDMLKKADEAIKTGNPYPNFQTKQLYIPFDPAQLKQGALLNLDSMVVTPQIPVTIGSSSGYITKDDLAILDVVASNIHERPVYFSTTCNPEKLQGLNDYTRLEGLALRVVPTASKSDPSFGIYGYGSVNANRHFDVITKNFKFGNFDKVKTHVDKSYMAAVQSIRLAMLRGAYDLIAKKDNARAAALIKKYFEGFPHMNFPYDGSASPFITGLFLAGDISEGVKHGKILLKEMKEYTDFYASLKNDELSSFMQDISQWQGAVQQMQAILSNNSINLPSDFKAESKKATDEASAKINAIGQRPMN